MLEKNLLVISNTFPDCDNTYVGNIFVKEQIRYLRHFFDNVYVISPVAYGMERLRRTAHENYQFDNVKVFFPKYGNVPISFFWGRSVWTHLESRAILSLINRENITFDLIHAHMTWPSGAVAVELKKRFNVPLVITEHTSDTFATAVKKNDLCWKKTLNASDAIIRVRAGDIELFEAFNISKEKIHVITNGYDTESFFPMSVSECRDRLGLPYEKKLLLYVGNFYDPVKGHKYLIEAIKRVINVRQDILGIIIGSGKLQRSIDDQISEFGLGPYIRLIGGKPHSEIPYWINACDLFVLPSLNEGNPTVLFETLGCGKPFLGTKVGGVPEIIVSDEYGLLVQPADSEDLAKNILRALDREWDREQIIAHSKQYTWLNIAEEIYKVYVQVMH